MSEGVFQAWQQTLSACLHMPLFSAVLLYGSCVCALLSITIPEVAEALANKPYETVVHYQGTHYPAYRLLTACVIPDNPISFLLSLAAYLSKATPRESKIGTVRLLSYFIATNLLVQVVFTAGMFGLTVLPTVASVEYSLPSKGLWGLVMAEVLVECGEDIEAPVK